MDLQLNNVLEKYHLTKDKGQLSFVLNDNQISVINFCDYKNKVLYSTFISKVSVLDNKINEFKKDPNNEESITGIINTFLNICINLLICEDKMIIEKILIEILLKKDFKTFWNFIFDIMTIITLAIHIAEEFLNTNNCKFDLSNMKPINKLMV